MQNAKAALSPDIVGHDRLKSLLAGFIRKAAARQKAFPLFFVRLRGLRRINLILGYAHGDSAMAHLQHSLSERGILLRISTDELVVIPTDCHSPPGAMKSAAEMMAILRKPVALQGVECLLDPVIGIALHQSDGLEADVLLRHAALAAERAEMGGEPFYAFFTECLESIALKEFDLQQQIRQAIGARQLILHYQPKINARTNALTGCEALIRWALPDGGLRMPGEFLGAAARGNLLPLLGLFGLAEGCRQIRSWLDRGFTNAAISINVSPLQLRVGDWVAVVARAIDEAGIPPARLTLELTEDCAMEDAGSIIAQLRALRRLGVKVAIDDFGTGHSSLAYLSRLPADEVKLDRFFVQTAATDRTSAQICKTVLELAHDLGMSVTAEGVETESQASWLRDLGCDSLQGFLFAKAMPAMLYEPWLACDGTPEMPAVFAESHAPFRQSA